MEKKFFQINYKFLDDHILYDGSQIKALWGMEECDVKGNSIICFVGPMKVKKSEMIDLQDISREKHLADILISSDTSLSFIIEHFDCQPANLLIAYHRLRLLVFIATEILKERFKGNWSRNGTDIFMDNMKVSVGIATISNTSMKIHFALNIAESGFPPYVSATGLKKFGPLSKDMIHNLAEEISRNYAQCVEGCWKDVTKTRTF
ncbi:MAG: DUF366 family protein [Asgard group archaeon]|nr:DUF366 family protein [Asgard group archaeon]